MEHDMQSKTMRGVFPILVTPFDDRDRIDIDSLQNLVDYCIAEGVHGFGIAYATEIPKLTEGERLQVAEVVVNHVGGRRVQPAGTGLRRRCSDEPAPRRGHARAEPGLL